MTGDGIRKSVPGWTDKKKCESTNHLTQNIPQCACHVKSVPQLVGAALNTPAPWGEYNSPRGYIMIEA